MAKMAASAAVMLAASALASLPAYSEEPVLRYSFEHVQDGVVPDLSGNGHHARIEGNAEPVEGGLRFNGRGALVIPEAASANIGDGGFIVEVVIELEPGTEWAVSEDRIGYLLLGNYREDWRAFNMGLIEGPILTFGVRGAGGAWRPRPQSEKPLPQGIPVHVAGTRDSRGRVALYINGHLQHFDDGGAAADISLDENGHISLGARIPGYGRALRGVIIRDFRFHARELSGVRR